MIRYTIALFFLFTATTQLFAQTTEITPACFNTDQDDFGMRKIGNKWYVVSAALSGKDGHSVIDSELNKPYSDLYEVTDNCTLKEAVLPSQEFQLPVTLSSMFHDGPLSGNGDVLFFTNSDGNKSSDKLGIYLLFRKDSLWSNAVAFPYNSKTFNSSHPFYVPETKTMYYASDEKGSLDLYSVSFDGTNFGTPNSLTTANSDSAECFPFYWNNKLYFTSNRTGSVGGYDLFVLANEQVTALDAPYNTLHDDLSIAFDTDSTGYFSSNRNSEGQQDDVFSFLIKQPTLAIDTTTTIIAEVKENKEHLKAEFTELLALRDEALKAGVSKDVLALVNRAIKAYEQGFPESIDKLSLEQLVAANKEFDGTRALIAQQIAQKTTANTATTTTASDEDLIAQVNELLKNSKIENVQFAYNSTVIEGEYISLLKGASELMKANKNWNLTLSGHTDNMGSAAFNLDLSKRRAEAVKAFLIQNGVPAARIFVEYYGLSQPLVPNDNVQNRLKNRRVEFKISAQL
jgi:outer membrane protein OmpA-like peptidoglycan-associated protein